MSDTPALIIIAGSVVTVIIALVAAGFFAGRSWARSEVDHEVERAAGLERALKTLLGMVGHHLTEEEAEAITAELARYRRPGGRHAAGGDPR